MHISFDQRKRDATLAERGLDFEEASAVFMGPVFTVRDLRVVYTEPRLKTFGLLRGRMVVVVWTPVQGGRRVISMRKANDREQRAFGQRLGEG